MELSFNEKQSRSAVLNNLFGLELLCSQKYRSCHAWLTFGIFSHQNSNFDALKVNILLKFTQSIDFAGSVNFNLDTKP